jgi:hypothetical protein
VQQAYETAESTAKEHDASVQLPHSDRQLESSSARDFFHEIRKRIGRAQAFVGVFTEGDVSLAIEASIASVGGKRILIVAENGDEVPRLLQGLPGLVAVSDVASLASHFRALLGKNRPPNGGSAGGTSASGRGPTSTGTGLTGGGRGV